MSGQPYRLCRCDVRKLHHYLCKSAQKQAEALLKKGTRSVVYIDFCSMTSDKSRCDYFVSFQKAMAAQSGRQNILGTSCQGVYPQARVPI